MWDDWENWGEECVEEPLTIIIDNIDEFGLGYDSPQPWWRRIINFFRYLW